MSPSTCLISFYLSPESISTAAVSTTAGIGAPIACYHLIRHQDTTLISAIIASLESASITGTIQVLPEAITSILDIWLCSGWATRWRIRLLRRSLVV